ncbi:MAG: hypothetical protein BWY70_01232 [Bacteroidetes bacterium ADurb.Bin408]|nr:MAG: hypothetical protein BWY70_01232 [Bacteroidetes bacterium ADurb.Bin408]
MTQNTELSVPCALPMMTANKTRTTVSVIIVPPTVMATDWFLAMPNLLTIGYAISVWVENILAISKLAVRL